MSWVVQNAGAGAPRCAGHVDYFRADELVYPQTFSTFNWFCIEIFVRQFFNSIAVIDAFEVNNLTILLRTNRCYGQRALRAAFNNDELRAD